LPNPPFWNLLVFLLIAFLVSFVPAAHTAAVAVEPDVTIRTQYGSLTPSRSQYYNNWSVYANGTVYFNATGLEAVQPQHTLFFRQVSFGNGTMVIRVQTPQQPVVSALAPAFNTYTDATDLLELQFTANQNAPLAIIWGTPFLVQSLVLTGAWVIGSIAGLIMILGLMNRMGLVGPGSKNKTPLNFFHTQGDENRNFLMLEVSMLILILIVTIMAFWLGGL